MAPSEQLKKSEQYCNLSISMRLNTHHSDASCVLFRSVQSLIRSVHFEMLVVFPWSISRNISVHCWELGWRIVCEECKKARKPELDEVLPSTVLVLCAALSRIKAPLMHMWACLLLSRLCTVWDVKISLLLVWWFGKGGNKVVRMVRIIKLRGKFVVPSHRLHTVFY